MTSDYLQWNPKITTPPGLYLTTLGFLKPFSELYAFGEEDAAKICPMYMLRFINVLFAAANCYIMYLIICGNSYANVSSSNGNNSSNGHLSNGSKSSAPQVMLTSETRVNRLMSSLQLATFPPLFFFSFFYYTDPGSLFFVLIMYYYHMSRHEWLASLFGLISLLYRQTNIIWCLFLASYTSLKIIQKYSDKIFVAKKKSNRIKSFVTIVAPQIVITCAGYLLLGLMFSIFLIINRGIVLGDRKSHEAVFHGTQVLYFLFFSFWFGFPWIMTAANFKRFLSYASSNKMKMISLASLMSVIISKTSHVHQYLISDNRHYTFYVWRRVLNRNSAMPYLLIPMYIYTGFTMISLISKQRDIIWKMLFVSSIFLNLIPQKLLEFRYFLTPFIIWRLNINSTNSTHRQLLAEFFMNTIINGVTLYIFLYKTFKWKHDMTDVQRFMW